MIISITLSIQIFLYLRNYQNFDIHIHGPKLVFEGSLCRYQAIATEKVHSTFKDFQHKETHSLHKRGFEGNLEIIAF